MSLLALSWLLSHRHRTWAIAPLLASCIWLVASPARGQVAGTATLRGSVLDPSGAGVPGATVALVNELTTDRRGAATDQEGAFSFSAVLSGRYTLRVARQAFKTAERTGLQVGSGDALKVDIVLTLGEQSETVTVRAASELIPTDTGAREYTLTQQQLANFSAIGRSALELLRLFPGVVAPEAISREKVGFYEGSNRTDSYTINGVRGTNNVVTLDGTNLIDFGTNSSVALSPNLDMVQEVKLQSSNYAAEYGSSAVQISATSRAGSSRFHGSAYHYLRHWRLQANDRSNSILGIDKPKSRFQYPGFNVGGPVLLPGTGFNRGRDRVFFFAGFEVQRQHLDNGSSLLTVPTAAQRRGDFSGNLLEVGQNLNQPAIVNIPTGFPNAGSPVPGNDLTPYVHPLGRALANLYPLPNYADPENRYNYISHSLQPSNRAEATVRFDYRISDGTQSFVRLARQVEDTESAGGIWYGGTTPFPTPGVSDQRTNGISSNIVSILSPSLTNEALVSFVRFNVDETFKDPSKLSKAALGVPDVGFFPTASAYVPLTVWGGEHISSLQSAEPVFAHGSTLQLANKITKLRGTHLMKLGVSLERGDKTQIWTNEQSGTVSLSTWGANTTGNEVADLVTGRPTSFRQGTPVPAGHFRFWNVEGFAQDSWRVWRRVTLEYGVRFGYFRNNRELNDLGGIFVPEFYDPAAPAFPDRRHLNGVRNVGRGEVGPGLTADRRPYWMPRLNAVWDVMGNGTTIVRGGVGRFVNRPEGNPDYLQLMLPPNMYNADIGSYEALGLGNGAGLTFDTVREVDPISASTASWFVNSISPFSVHYPETTSMSVSLARALPWHQLVEAAYVGTRGRHLQTQRSINAVPPGALFQGVVNDVDLSVPVNRVALDSSVVNQFRPFTAYDGIVYSEFEGKSRYDSLQVTLSRQAGGRLQYLAAYTLGKTTGTVPGLINLIDPKRNESVLDSDRRHMLTTSFNLLVPDLPAHTPRWLGAAANGWQVSGVATFSSGTPIRLSLGGELSNTGIQQAWFGSPSVTEGGFIPGIAPVYAKDPRNLWAQSLGQKLFDINAIQIPSFGDARPAEPPFDFRTPSKWTTDIALSKNIRIRGSQNLQVRIAAFDLFNTAYPTDVDLALSVRCKVVKDDVPTGAGYNASGVCDPTGGFEFTEQTLENFGRIILLRGHRIVETALKYSW